MYASGAPAGINSMVVKIAALSCSTNLGCWPICIQDGWNQVKVAQGGTALRCIQKRGDKVSGCIIGHGNAIQRINMYPKATRVTRKLPLWTRFIPCQAFESIRAIWPTAGTSRHDHAAQTLVHQVVPSGPVVHSHTYRSHLSQSRSLPRFVARNTTPG